MGYIRKEREEFRLLEVVKDLQKSELMSIETLGYTSNQCVIMYLIFGSDELG